MEINQLGVQHGAIFILYLQLYPSATAAQTLDNTEYTSRRGGIIADLPLYLCTCVISSSSLM